jgi:hypothetical protein
MAFSVISEDFPVNLGGISLGDVATGAGTGMSRNTPSGLGLVGSDLAFLGE